MIRHLHNLTENFLTEICPFETIQNYEKTCLDLNIKLPEEMVNSLLPSIRKLQEEIPHSEKKVPTHHGNLLDGKEKLWLIDWEYAAMGDPLFDLATLASTENFSDHQMTQLLVFLFQL